ncbi:cathepsin A1-like protein, partial [Leptotrombidium deliense]
GNFDIIVNSPSVDKMIESLEWNGKEKYVNSERKIWKRGNNVIGYVKQSGNLTRVVFRNAGHATPLDQSKYSFAMLKKFVNG